MLKNVRRPHSVYNDSRYEINKMTYQDLATGLGDAIRMRNQSLVGTLSNLSFMPSNANISASAKMLAAITGRDLLIKP